MSPKVDKGRRRHYKEKANLHIHTYHSDGIFTPKMILSYARRKKTKVLSITDHNMIKGTLQGLKFAERYGIIFFPGVECVFSVGDKYFEILAYFENETNITSFFNEFQGLESFIPKFSSIKAVTDLIERHDGVAIAPHPFGRKGVFRHKKNGQRIIFGGAGYEQINAFTGRIRNKRAKKFLNHERCIVLGSADMHFFRAALDVCYTELVSELPITRKNIWDNLTGKKETIDFIPKGKSFPTHLIWFQKVLCASRLDLLRHYFYFLLRKVRMNKESPKVK